MNQFIDEVEDTILTHYTIMNELKINLLEFREYMDLLEGIGLIKTFVKHDSNQSMFIYELIQPPTAYQFFNDPMLSIYLYNEVDNLLMYSKFHIKIYLLMLQQFKRKIIQLL